MSLSKLGTKQGQPLFPVLLNNVLEVLLLYLFVIELPPILFRFSSQSSIEHILLGSFVLFLLFATTPYAQRHYTIVGRVTYCGQPLCIFATRPRLFLYREREREPVLFALLVIKST